MDVLELSVIITLIVFGLCAIVLALIYVIAIICDSKSEKKDREQALKNKAAEEEIPQLNEENI